jgi:hypothetical protein
MKIDVAEAEIFSESWNKRPINLERVDTDMFRAGWCKPTIYHEHEAIHILCDALDTALAEIERLKRDNEI